MQIIELINFVAAILLAGLLSFLATLLVKQTGWPSWLSLALSFALAFLFALATAWVNGNVMTIVAHWGDITGEELFSFTAFIWTTATGWYWLVFRDASWAKKLAAWPSPRRASSSVIFASRTRTRSSSAASASGDGEWARAWTGAAALASTSPHRRWA